MAYKMNGPSLFKMKSPLKRGKTTLLEKVKAVGGTASDIVKSNEPITAIGNISKTYKLNKAYQRHLSKQKKKKNQ
tara:strand:+ start:304 stop:528 length:225 start_codon:yes stop_codon:yes gene_type:complete